jgi:fimbrial chaperone protein
VLTSDWVPVMASVLDRVLRAVMCIALATASQAFAGEFSVNPIRLDLRASARSGAIGVRNEGKEKLSFQLQAMSWSQDAEGKDQYAETQDLVFFPRILSVEAGEEGLVRVGAKNAVVESEKTYRLFIEELPGPVKTPQSGAQVNVLVRFGAPVFLAPVRAQDGLDITRVELAKAVLSLSARNTGNRHQIIRGVDVKVVDSDGKVIYSVTLADRYMLAGASKTFGSAIPIEHCAKAKSVAVEVKTDKASASQKLDITPAMCP